ncbi:hypothetical protein J8L09_11805 [Bacteroides fragilis]|uniref:hypothetical protein n=1 Tax=Bacteroides fragilis TaxID=817 RepID=UPI002030BCA4|nr:hypothetical protein [Bacteroides fragilis]MCM0206543.1 hypothetical protein [Bacteroides fragilis]
MNARLSSNNPVRPQTVHPPIPPFRQIPGARRLFIRSRFAGLFTRSKFVRGYEASSSEATKQVRPRLRSRFVRGYEAGSSEATKQVRPGLRSKSVSPPVGRSRKYTY